MIPHIYRTIPWSYTVCVQAMLLGGVLLSGPSPMTDAAEQATVRFRLDGAPIEGTPVAWTNANAMLLARNGFLLEFTPQQAEDYRLISDRFRPFSQSEMRGQLLREFGDQYDVSGTGNYLVVHPVGERDRWAPRFEGLFRSFVHYFSVRGARPTAPEFPLVAVVFASPRDFVEYVRRNGGNVPPGVVGFYSQQTNRVLLYDVTHGQAPDADWQRNATTIIHEATHQMAFNTRIHSRLAAPPRWVAEGLALLFEAPGVWDPHKYPRAKDRLNPARLSLFQEYLNSQRPAGSLPLFIQNSDRVFAAAPSIAYPEAWALTYFLSETEPAKYLRYLALTAAREPLKDYTASEQLKEFTDVFGSDLRMLEARYLRFMKPL